MTGSIWYQIQVPADNYVLIDVPAGVEARIYRGTATLAGMTYRDVSNDTVRKAFFLASIYTYFVKLQSATATEAGVLNVRPFAWTDWILPAPVQERGHEEMTRLNGSNTDGLTTDPTLTAAWSNALLGTVVQLALNAAPVGIGSEHEPLPRRSQLLDLGAQAVAQLLQCLDLRILQRDRLLLDYAELSVIVHAGSRPEDAPTFDRGR